MKKLIAFAALCGLTTACSGDSYKYDPCAGKSCGETCKACRPNDANCVETMIFKTCDSKGQCGDGGGCGK